MSISARSTSERGRVPQRGGGRGTFKKTCSASKGGVRGAGVQGCVCSCIMLG